MCPPALAELSDSIYADVGLMTTQRSADGYLAAINLGLDL